jgi:hypothetical protein
VDATLPFAVDAVTFAVADDAVMTKADMIHATM